MTLYHATPADNLDSVLTDGILPSYDTELSAPIIWAADSPLVALAKAYEMEVIRTNQAIRSGFYRELPPKFAIFYIDSSIIHGHSWRENCYLVFETVPPTAIRHVQEETLETAALLYPFFSD
ncbi:hypothetical protein HYX08_00905 [Candidatus Woesearchaeota archaeon]|nr:hypothetical protein [Candidatus Woesearchaeota archaeon]